MFNPLKYFRNTKVGLALGSGGAKGMAHIAVLDYLGKMSIPIDRIAGSSIGAVIGALYCTGTLKSFEKDILDMTRRGFLSFFDPVFPRSGLIQGNESMDFIAKYIPRAAKIEDLPIPLAITATDFYSGKTVVFRSGNIIEALRASVSIPGVFIPVRYKSTFLIDGGVSNPLPVNIIRGMGSGLTIAVNLHPTIEKRKWKVYVKSRVNKFHTIIDSRDIEIMEAVKKGGVNIPASTDKTRPVQWLGMIERWFKPENNTDPNKLPNIFEIIMQTIDIMEYMNTLMILKYNSPTVLIEPYVEDTGTLDFEKSKKIIDEGTKACDNARSELLRKVKIWV